MKNKVTYLTIVYLFMLFIIFLLPFYSAEKYSILKNTTSELGAQNTPNSWIMNITFALLGLCSIFDGWKFLNGYWFHRIVLTVFGISLILAAYFQHAPIGPGITFSVEEDSLHSLFSTITGFLFTFFAVSSSFILKMKSDKIIALFIGVMATALSLMIFTLPEFAGIWQRFIFISSFGWMIYLFRAKNKLQIPNL